MESLFARPAQSMLNGKLQVHIGSGVRRGPSLGYHSFIISSIFN